MSRKERSHEVIVRNRKCASTPNIAYAAKSIKKEISGYDTTMLAVIDADEVKERLFLLRASTLERRIA